MSASTKAPPKNAQDDPESLERQLEREKLKLSRFDAVTSLFLALILFLGAFVLMMFII